MRIFQRRICFLCLVISEKGVEVDQERVEAVEIMKAPTTNYASLTVIGAILTQRQNGWIEQLHVPAKHKIKANEITQQQKGNYSRLSISQSFPNVSAGAEICYCNRPSAFGFVVLFQGP